MKTRKYSTLFLLLALVIGIQQKAEAQGTTQLIQDELLGIKNETKWHGFVSAGYSRSQDQYDDGFYRTSGQISYDLSPGRQLYANIGYLRPGTNSEEEVLRWGLTDLSVGITQPAFKLNLTDTQAISGLLFVEGTLPTSERSQNATNMGSAALGLALTSVYKRLIMTTSHVASYSFFEYETASAQGVPTADARSSYNQPIFFSNGATLILRLTNRLNLSGGYNFAYLENFAGTVIKINTYSSSLNVIYSPKINFGGFIRNRDRLVTNNQLFDDDTVVTGGFVRYIF